MNVRLFKYNGYVLRVSVGKLEVNGRKEESNDYACEVNEEVLI
jgi:hypothetical protein